MRTLLIDDIRNIDVDVVARDYFEGLRQLEFEGPWDLLLLDHDLASFKDGREFTGYDIMSWLEEFPQFMPKKIICVSANPVGRDRINKVIEVIRKKL